MSFLDRYTHEQLTEAFRLVGNKENWKLPIDAIVPLTADISLIKDAVAYFTGGLPDVIPARNEMGGLKGYRVISEGYYYHIGS